VLIWVNATVVTPDDDDTDDETDDELTDDKPTDDKPTDDKPTDDKPTDDEPTDDGGIIMEFLDTRWLLFLGAVCLG